jgi:uncharacterized protein (TIGR03435 family)
MMGSAAARLCSFSILCLFASGFAAALAPHGIRGVLAGNDQVSATQREETQHSKAVPAAAPVFEVAAIRENQSDHTARSHIISSPNDGRFTAINVPLKMLIQFAFGIPDSRILDGPGWIDATKFDIDAKADSAVDDQMRTLSSIQGKAQKRLMLQALLADRFKLRVHAEDRELPMYALVVARNGPKFLDSKANGTTIDGGNGRIQVQGGDNSVSLLAEQLADSLGRPVNDQTGIKGRYSITLQWAPDDDAAPKSGGTEDNSATLDSPGPSLFTAIQEQLGLKLEPRKGPVQVLIVDHIERPSAN